MNVITKVTPQKDQEAVNYPRNSWWVAAYAKDVTHAPLGIWMLDRPILLYRTGAGSVVALDDRCPHRWAPLSKGTLFGDNIECKYHGIMFGPDGKCVKIPTQEHISNNCKVHAYPILESGPFIWVWMGDPDRIADYPPPPNNDWALAPGWTATGGILDIAGNYQLLMDNLMDLSHFGFLHRGTLDLEDWDKPPELDVQEDKVVFWQKWDARPLPGMAAFVSGLERHQTVEYLSEATWMAPGFFSGRDWYKNTNAKPGERSEFNMRTVHALTPMSMNTFRYFYFGGFDVEMPADAMKAMTDIGPVVFKEDGDMTEWIQQIIDRDTRTDYPEIVLAADAPQMAARRLLKKWLDREQ